ncbi:MAG: hypothetical protein ABIQ39_03175 [Ilumatobacteraceae bacterium]
MSNTKLVVDVKNVGDRACQLQTEPPTLAGISADGTVTPFPTTTQETFFGAPLAIGRELAVGAVAEVWIGGGQPGVCDPIDATQQWPSMVLGFADGTTTSFTTGFDTKCGVTGITPFGAPST